MKTFLPVFLSLLLPLSFLHAADPTLTKDPTKDPTAKKDPLDSLKDPSKEDATPTPPPGSVLTKEEAIAKKRLEQKLASIIVPQVEFKDATARECAEYLRKKSAELDPEKTGINILLKGDPEAKITLSLRNIPLGEAIRYFAEQANMAVRVDPYAVAIAPK